MKFFRSAFAPLAAILFALVGTALRAQSTIDTGSLRGKVLDAGGKALPGAIVRAKGPQGSRASESDTAGNYNIPFLVPGTYEVTVTMDGYSTQMQSGVQIVAQQISGQTFKLSEGSDTIIVKAAQGVDTRSTAATTSVNLGDAVQAFAQDHSFTAAFDFAPGAIANSGVGGGNYSISGASGLENQYLVGGVNITNSGYGAIGAYDQVSGRGSTGITTQFLDNLDIREGGFEAEYGGALGGVISATIRSGSNDWKGAVNVFVHPRSLDAAPASFNQAGGFVNDRGSNNLDLAFELGGPIVRDRLFFFVGYNPVWSEDFLRLDVDGADLAKDKIVAPFANKEYSQGNNRVDNYALHFTWNVSAKHKLDLALFGSPEARTGNLRLPSLGRRVNARTDLGIPTNPPNPRGAPATDPLGSDIGTSKVRDFSASLKYFGTIFPWLNVEAVVSFHRNQVIETPAASASSLRYTDQRRSDIYTAQKRYGETPIVSPATYQFGGLGAYQGGSNDQNINYLLKVTHNFHFGGEHELKWGAEYADIKYRENFQYTGKKPEIYLGGGADGYAIPSTGVQANIRCFRIPANSPNIQLACSAQQAYRVYRGNFNPPTPNTRNQEMNLFIQDRWTIKNVTFNLGVRWTREKISNPSSYALKSTHRGANGQYNPLVVGGNPVGSRTPDCVTNNDYSPACYIAGPGIFVGNSFQFRGEFSPRIGLSWDVLGNGKAKLYANYARLYERIPNDLAVRSFGNEFGVTWVPFQYADLTGQYSPARTTGSQPTRVAPGSRMPFKDDFIVGYKFEVRPLFLVDIKASFRKQGRILEDTQAAPVEAIQNYYYNRYLTPSDPNGSCTSGCTVGQTELFPGAGYGRFGEYVLANIPENAPTTFDQVYPFGTSRAGGCPPGFPYNGGNCDGFPTGMKTPITFGKPKSNYKALSITLTKQPAEGEHVWLQASYRISKLIGNYEGLFRNDNGQSDPNITSLFDFPDSPQLHTQYTMGKLNTDTPHSLKINVGYNDLFIKNLSGAVTFKWQSGQLRTPQLAHPVYQNAGEIPGLNPQYYEVFATGTSNTAFVLKNYTPVERGYLGRAPDDAVWNVKLGYKVVLGKSALDFSVLVNNIFNDTHVVRYDDNVERTTGATNPFYGNPAQFAPDGTFKAPRSVRLGARWSF